MMVKFVDDLTNVDVTFLVDIKPHTKMGPFSSAIMEQLQTQQIRILTLKLKVKDIDELTD